jgi:hypothetical protein
MNTEIVDYKLVSYGGSLAYGINIASELEEKVKYQISQDGSRLEELPVRVVFLRRSRIRLAVSSNGQTGD